MMWISHPLGWNRPFLWIPWMGLFHRLPPKFLIFHGLADKLGRRHRYQNILKLIEICLEKYLALLRFECWPPGGKQWRGDHYTMPLPKLKKYSLKQSCCVKKNLCLVDEPQRILNRRSTQSNRKFSCNWKLKIRNNFYFVI